jgi:hypothetical protein
MTIGCLENITSTNTSGRIDYPYAHESEFVDTFAMNQTKVALPESCCELFQTPFVNFSASSGVVSSACRFGSGEVIFKIVKPNTFDSHPLSLFLGAWKGDDIEEMLDIVHKSRSKF